jgi:hypothetical protein
LPITLHLRLNAHHSPRRLQPADTHPLLHIVSEHLVLQASDGLLERPPLTLKPPVSVDFGPQGPITDLTDGLVDVVTDLQGPPSGRTQSDKIRDLKSLAKQYARDRGSCDDTRISYLEYVESEAEADWTLARMIAG